MTANTTNYQSFSDIQQRLDEILETVSQEDISLDNALALCEEAVSLGLQASDRLEEGVVQAVEEEPQAGEAAENASAATAVNTEDAAVPTSTEAASEQ